MPKCEIARSAGVDCPYDIGLSKNQPCQVCSLGNYLRKNQGSLNLAEDQEQEQALLALEIERERRKNKRRG